MFNYDKNIINDNLSCVRKLVEDCFQFAVTLCIISKENLCSWVEIQRKHLQLATVQALCPVVLLHPRSLVCNFTNCSFFSRQLVEWLIPQHAVTSNCSPQNTPFDLVCMI